MWDFINRLFNRDAQEKNRKSRWPKYAVDEIGFLEISTTGTDRKFLWTDIQHVGILTTADGPWFDDVFFIIKTSHGGICVTTEQSEEINLFKWFDSFLPGFKWDQVVEAMCCTSEASFACWDRSWESQTAVVD